MKIGLVGYQGFGKSTVFELLTGQAPDPGKVHSGQVGVATVPDRRFDRLVEHYNPKKTVPAKIELFDTPGLDRTDQKQNAPRLGIIRESAGMVHVIGAFAGADPLAEVESFEGDLVLADLQVITNRIDRLRKDAAKPRPDREELQEELVALEPLAKELEEGRPLRELKLSELQQKACRAFGLLTRKPVLVLINTADSDFDQAVIDKLAEQDRSAIAAPVGLELEVASLDAEERQMFAEEMGLKGSSQERLLRAIFEVTDQITFYTSGEKEVHAWLLRRGSTALEAADSIHSDLARGFVRAEVWQVDDLLKAGSERELKAQGLNHVEGKEYIVQDGDELFIRANV